MERLLPGVALLVPAAGGLILLVFVISIVSSMAGAKRQLSAVLVLREFTVVPNPVNGFYVRIVGRPSGILQWLGARVGITVLSTFLLAERDLAFYASDLTGQVRQVVPLSAVASTHCGYHKPFWRLVSGVMVALMGMPLLSVPFLIPLSFLFLISGGVLIASYWLQRVFFINIETSGGLVLGLRFKRSVIEGVSFDFENASQVINLINTLVLSCRGGGMGSSPAGSQPSTPVTRPAVPGPSAHAPAPAAPPPRPASPPTCPRCGQGIEPGKRFCENCGTKLI